MLASQAAVALDNAQWSQGLEQKVAQRTGELQTSNALLEQRANELAIINSIQQGMAAELDFQAIVDLVGDKLREVFNTGDIGIRWCDEKTDLIHYLYQYEHGVRLQPRTDQAQSGGPSTEFSRRRDRGREQPRRAGRARSDDVSRHRPEPFGRRRSHRREQSRPGHDRAGGLRTGERLRRIRSAPAHARWPRAWASRWRTHASSTRRSGC